VPPFALVWDCTSDRSRYFNVDEITNLYCARFCTGPECSKRANGVAAKRVPPTAYEPPNRLMWRLSEILAAHLGQASWRLPVVKTRDFEADWISMVPGEKTKTVFYANDRVF